MGKDFRGTALLVDYIDFGRGLSLAAGSVAGSGPRLRLVGGLSLAETGLVIDSGGATITGAFAAGTTLSRGTGVDTANTFYDTAVFTMGSMIVTQIIVDLTDLVSSTTDLDIVGEDDVANCSWGQITTAVNGVIIGGKMTCLEAPAGGQTDIDIYSATVSTGTEDAAITALVETALISSGGAWTSGRTLGMTLLPPADDYIYFVVGAAGTAAAYTAGKFLIELYGT